MSEHDAPIYRFKRLVKFDIPLEFIDASSTEGDDEWMKIAERCNDKSTFKIEDNHSPLWKITLVKSVDCHYLMFVWSHSISDGVAGFIAINDIISLCSRVYEDSITKEVDSSNLSTNRETVRQVGCSGKLMPDIAHLCFPRGLSKQEHKEFNEMYKKKISKQLKLCIPFVETGIESSSGHIIFRGKPENLKELIKVSKSKGVTVGNIAAASIYFTVAKQLLSVDKSSIEFSLDYDVNMRFRVPGYLDQLGFSIVLMSLSFEVTRETTFWDLTRKISETMKSQTESKDLFYSSMLLDKIVDWYDANLLKYGLECGDMNLSNIGRYSHPKSHGPFSIHELHTIASSESGAWNHTFFLHSIDYMTYGYEYDKSLGTHEYASAWFYDICQLVERAHTLDESFAVSDILDN
eukprot:TRINITY_DN1247_c2_g1_i2.p1 TRINITY_DN1247_c2_g1~~TRINITY_DN1247_c2_g1_i2.p1  ORF type:complete len:460 (-),score=39.27 TRINITY_DN1247_c2_g1_i2:345-1562(-)